VEQPGGEEEAEAVLILAPEECRSAGANWTAMLNIMQGSPTVICFMIELFYC
jgi:hypothetical protein